MNEKNGTLKKLYCSYLEEYIKNLTFNKVVYYISICDIEYEIIDLLQDFKIEGINVAIVNKREYSKAVEYRNNTTVSKIVLLTPDSVKKIDSLKDFNEYSVFPDVEENKEMFWGIIKTIFCLEDEQIHRVEKFINLIIKEKRISLSQFFKLFENSIENNKINIQKLNNNLFMVNCWKSDGSSSTNITNLKKLIRLSDPTEIEKRISVMSTEELNTKQLRDFTAISKLSFENNYDELFKKYSFENLPEKFTEKSISPKKTKNKDDDFTEVTKQFKFSYEAYIEETQSIPVFEFEETLLDSSIEQFTNVIEEYEDEFNKIIVKDISIKIQKIINDIKNGIDIHPKSKEGLIKRIEHFEEITSNTYNSIKQRKTYPYLLESFCRSTKDFLNAYINLLSFIATDENASYALNKNKIIEDIQSLFITIDERKLTMSFMHPIAIFFFNCTNAKYNEILPAYKEYDSNAMRILLDGVLNVNTTQFPVNILTYNNKIYVIDESYQKSFAYYEFREKTRLSSESTLDIRIITNSIERYITEFPYKSEIIVSIVGSPSFKNIGSLNKIIYDAMKFNRSIIRKFRIDIISENHKEVSKEIDDFYNSENLNNTILFRLVNLKSGSDSRTILDEVLEKSDVVFVFDCDILYKKEELRKIAVNYTSTLSEIKRVCSNENFLNQTINEDFPIGVLWPTLHNVLLEGENSLSTWSINEVDNSIINLIRSKIECNNELLVCMLTSNLSIISKIYMKNKFSSSILKSKGKEYLTLTFSAYIINKKLIDDESKFTCECSLKDVLQSILDDVEIEEFVKDMQYDPKEILGNLVLKFNYDNDNNKVQATCLYPEDESESFDEVEYKRIWKFILKYAFGYGNSHSILLKSLIINYLYISIRSLGDALLVNHIERYLKFDVDNDVYLEAQLSHEERPQDNNITNVRNMLAYLEKYNSVDERFKTGFKYEYDIDELKKLRIQANKIHIIDKKLLSKIDFILKGE